MIKKKFTREDYLQMQKTAVPLKKRSTEGFLFGYAKLPSCGFMGSSGGFSFIVYDSGKVEVREYLFSELLAEERFYNVPESCIDKIKELYQNAQDEIKTLELPYNGSYDGSFDHFFFGGQWISELNVYGGDERAVSDRYKGKPKELQRVLSIVRAENKVIKYFISVSDILNEYDIILRRDHVTIDGEPTGSPIVYEATESPKRERTSLPRKLFGKKGT